tara:strand:- start:293 stop:1441 length:1149 start_codon:yes stop_codon:yes gene_type:complete
LILERKRERNKHINKLVEYLIKMFRDLKEYQEIQKLYSENVSKPENLEENRNTRGSELAAKRLANKPKSREELGLPPKKKISPFERKFGKERNEKRLQQSGLKKPIPTTAEIRKANPNIVPGTRVNEVGAQGGGKPSEGDFKKDFPDKKPEISKLTKQGKPRTKAQMMAAKRIGSGTAKNPDTTIAQVKQKNQDDMRARAKAKFAAFKAKRAEKKLDKQRDFDDPDKKMNRGESYIPDSNIDEKMNINPGSGRDTINEPGALKVYRNVRTVANLIPAIGKTLAGDKNAFKKMEKKEVERYKNPKGIERVATGIADKLTGDKFDFDMKGKSKTKKEEFTPYDIVLEYLLSSEQVATIEEANYVMTEMDAETIQGIVEEQKKTL